MMIVVCAQAADKLGLSERDAEEVVGRAWEVFDRAHGDFTPGEGSYLDRFLRGIAYNVCRDVRGAHWNRTVLRMEDEALDQAVAGAGEVTGAGGPADLDALVADKRLREAIDAIAGSEALTVRQREAFRRRLEDQLSTAEIATRMGITQDAVQLYLREASARIRAGLRRHGLLDGKEGVK